MIWGQSASIVTPRKSRKLKDFSRSLARECRLRSPHKRDRSGEPITAPHLRSHPARCGDTSLNISWN